MDNKFLEALRQPDGIIRTKGDAIRRRDYLQSVIGVQYLIFVAPPGTVAYEYGYRYGVCRESEREDYAKDGAEFISP